MSSRDPVLQHVKLIEALHEDPATMTSFFMDGSSFRDIPGGYEIKDVIGDGCVVSSRSI